MLSVSGNGISDGGGGRERDVGYIVVGPREN